MDTNIPLNVIFFNDLDNKTSIANKKNPTGTNESHVLWLGPRELR